MPPGVYIISSLGVVCNESFFTFSAKASKMGRFISFVLSLWSLIFLFVVITVAVYRIGIKKGEKIKYTMKKIDAETQ